ncbi:SH2 domain-containing protein 5 isoform X2 [Ambystoma mexicanum]|uniref:SH2 domain-containing protein 5 isoform X2 n=1 Tax=Ambystoma mexicanum TaxID=8296 RepID=UPI0037E813EA
MMRKKSGSERKWAATRPKARVITKFTEDCLRRRPVILKFSLQGVKMYSAAGEILLMAHALKRILYTTCRPVDRQFAFVARNPQGLPQEIFCHLFVGSQSSEVQVMNLLLCRTFQLQYLSVHREEQEKTLKKLPKLDAGKADAVVREPLDPSRVSQNINALVSFRRLPYAGDIYCFNSEDEKAEEESISCLRDSTQENLYCSPILVRKKAIRSKVLRSGAYHCNSFGTQQQYDGKPDRPSWVSASAAACSCGSTTHLPESDAVLTEAVWSFAGICRDAAISLLSRDVLGAFLMRAEPGCKDKWSFTLRTQCGVTSYQIVQTSQGTYSFEHLSEEFPTLASLVAHHSGTNSRLFHCLVSGRLNPSYEEHDLVGWSWIRETCNQEKQPTIQEQPAATELAG